MIALVQRWNFPREGDFPQLPAFVARIGQSMFTISVGGSGLSSHSLL
jgi:hypothetical protein